MHHPGRLSAGSPTFASIGRVCSELLGRPSQPLTRAAFCERLRASDLDSSLPLAEYLPTGMGPWKADYTFSALGEPRDAPLCGVGGTEELVCIYLRWHITLLSEPPTTTPLAPTDGVIRNESFTR